MRPAKTVRVAIQSCGLSGEGHRVGGVWVGSRLDQEGRESGESDSGGCEAVG